MSLSTFLDKTFPRRVCRRDGHAWDGGMFLGPHRDSGGGEFIGLRYRIFCRRCGGTLDNTPRAEWPSEDPLFGDPRNDRT